MGDSRLALSSLQKAIQKNPSLSTQLDYDLEFAGLRGLKDFQSLIGTH